MPDCPSCDRYFASAEALIQHTEAKHGKANVHNGVRMWERSRDQSGELTTGHRVGSYAYEVTNDMYDYDCDVWTCTICYRGFVKRSGLEQHLNSGVHESDLYRCQGCDRTFRNLGALNQHVTMTECSPRAARQVRTLLQDASHAQGLLMLTDQSHRPASRAAQPEGTLFFDGSATPNPGDGGAGFQLLDDRGREVSSVSIRVRTYPVTNNQAEYAALILGMLEAEREGMKRIKIKGDSDLVIKQMQGEWNVSNQKMIPLNNYANQIESRFKSVTYEWIPRDSNAVANELANNGREGYADREARIDRSHLPVWYVDDDDY